MHYRILLINIHSSCNAGDAALTQTAIEQLEENFPGSQLTLLMNDPESHTGPEERIRAFLPWVQEPGKNQLLRFSILVVTSMVAILSRRWLGSTLFLPRSDTMRPGLQAIFDADLVVGTPGGYLYSYGKGRALIILLYTMAIALMAGKPLYLLPQSYGPFRFRREKWLARWVITRAQVIMVREPVSVQHLQSCGIPEERCLLLPDLAFDFRSEAPSTAVNWLQTQGIDPQRDRPLLGVTTIDWGAQFQGYDNQKEYESALASALHKFLTRHGGKVVFLPQSWGPSPSEDDRLPARRIASQIKGKPNSVFVVNSPLSPGLLKAVFGEMDIFIGTRMHSNIFALSQNVPVIAIGYLHKTLGIAQSVGIQDWVLDINNITEDILSQSIEKLWENRLALRRHLEIRVPEIIQETRQAGKIIVADYAGRIKDYRDGSKQS